MGIGNSNETLTTGISRRTVTKGIAWAAPAVAIAGAAPAYASSPIPPNGLNGWVALSRRCGFFNNPNYLSVDGRGSYPSRGLWTFVPDPQADITNATITFYFNRSNLSFNNGSGSESGWSDLVRNQAADATAPAAGFFAYTTTYTGGWTWRPTMQGPDGMDPGGWEANNDPFFTASGAGCGGAISAYARRSITVNGETVTFLRGPIRV